MELYHWRHNITVHQPFQQTELFTLEVSTVNYMLSKMLVLLPFHRHPSSGAPLTIQFNDTSVYNPTSWAWDLETMRLSTEQNPVHYLCKGWNYTVTHTAANDYGSDR